MTATLIATPDDDPTRRYQADGLAATMAALDASGPLAPVPYFADATTPTRRRRTRVPRADLDLVLSDAYLDYLLGVADTRPAAAGTLAA